LQATQKKNSEGCPFNQVSAAAMTSASDEKMATLQLFFSVQGTGGIPTGQDPENGWVINTLLEAQVDQFILGCE